MIDSLHPQPLNFRHMVARTFTAILRSSLLVLLATATVWAQPGDSEIADRERAGDAAVQESAVNNSPPVEAPYLRRKSETEFGAIRVNPDFKVTKVHSYENTPSVPTTGNEALNFERKYWSWGGITNEELEMRQGHYFVISWSSKRAQPGDYIARFEYRQRNSKEKVKRLEIPHNGVKGTVRSTFAVLGKAYTIHGEVISWRFTLWDGDELVAQETSFVW